MKRELGIGRCGLACCLCSENDACTGCSTGSCPDRDRCENRRCSIEKGIGHCYECGTICRKGHLAQIRPYAFTLSAERYGEQILLDCLERNERSGIRYHRDGLHGDYDGSDDPEQLIAFIPAGRR